MQKKFTCLPIGLGLKYLENESLAAYIWNELVDKKLPANSLWKCSPQRLKGITNRIYGNTMLSLGIVEKKGELYKLSDSTIQKIEEYLNKHY